MVDKKSWQEFKDAGLLWWINTMLHTFGWALVLEVDGVEIKNVYPARVKFRGFSEKSNTNGYKKLTKHLNSTISELRNEVNDE